MGRVLLLALSLAVTAPPPAEARPRTVACCIPVFIPGLSTEPRCLVVNVRVRSRRVGARRICRLLGGDPVRRGRCRCPGLGEAAAP
jgi:hypothetical protein